MGLSENPDRNPVGGGATEAEMLNEMGLIARSFVHLNHYTHS